jgi:hypothetical protein
MLIIRKKIAKPVTESKSGQQDGFENPIHQTTFETLMYIKQTMF